MQGGTAKSGKYRYYGCYNHLRKGADVCNAKMFNAEALERSVVAKLKERVLTPENLRELLKLTNTDLQRRGSKVDEEIQILGNQVQIKQGKLDRLYSALENGQLDLADLSPRIKVLKGEVDELNEAVTSAKLRQSSTKTLRVLSKSELERYVADLYDLLAEGEVFERRAFLASFIERISVDYPKVSVTYTIPLINKPPHRSEVLCMVTNGGVLLTDLEFTLNKQNGESTSYSNPLPAGIRQFLFRRNQDLRQSCLVKTWEENGNS